MTHLDIARKLYRALPNQIQGVEQAYLITRQVFDIMRDAIIQGDEIRSRNFGTLKRVTSTAKVGHNFHTGERVSIPARPCIKFEASTRLLAKIRNTKK